MPLYRDLSGNGVGAEIDNPNYRAGMSLSGYGSPENVVNAVVGTEYHRLDGGANTTLYVKESGTGNTGWVGK